MGNAELIINIELKGNTKDKSNIDILQLEAFIKDLLINGSNDQLDYFFRDYYGIEINHKTIVKGK